jgi:hypothetical protein
MADGAQFFGRLLRPGLVQRRHVHLGAVVEQPPGDAELSAASTAGHDRSATRATGGSQQIAIPVRTALARDAAFTSHRA